jgi:hypothetical protein
MSGELREAVERYDPAPDADVLREGLALLDVLTAKLAAAAGRFDAEVGYEAEGAVSLTGWLRGHAGLSSSDAGRLARTAKRCRQLPVTAAAWESGALSGAQVQAIVANVSDRTVGLFAEHEPEVVPVLVPLTVPDTVTAMQLWRQRAEAQLDDGQPAGSDERLHLSRTMAGRRELSGSFEADGGSVIETALRLATTRDDDGETRTPAQRRADALVDLCQWYLDHHGHAGAGRHRPHVNVIVDVDDFHAGGSGQLDDGTLLPRPSVERLLCDCALHRVVRDQTGSIVDYGRATRSIPVNLWAALVVRDRGCRHPGCDRPVEWCDGHHVNVHWEHGGETNLDNLVLLCRRHHTLAHRPGWSDELLPDGTYQVNGPDGRTRTTAIPGTLLGAAA